MFSQMILFIHLWNFSEKKQTRVGYYVAVTVYPVFHFWYTPIPPPANKANEHFVLYTMYEKMNSRERVYST